MKQISMTIAALFFGVVLAGAGCKKKEEAKTETPKAAEGSAAPAAPAGSAAAPAAPAGDMAAGSAAPAAPTEMAATGMSDCDELNKLTAKFLTCDKLAADVKKSQTEAFEMQKQSWAAMATAPEDMKKQTNDVCKENVGMLKKNAKDAGCPVE